MIVVAEYDPAWPERLELLRREYAARLKVTRVRAPGRTRHSAALGVQGTGAACGNQHLHDRGGCLSLRNHLGLRAALCADAALRDGYAAVKWRAGARAADIDQYGQITSEMVQKILVAAGLTEAERASIASSNAPTHDEVPR
jgi:GrpB-like predicted nucleotidyltransferase (UPF0157 family)